jgi:hypothetical protein
MYRRGLAFAAASTESRAAKSSRSAAYRAESAGAPARYAAVIRAESARVRVEGPGCRADVAALHPNVANTRLVSIAERMIAPVFEVLG